MFDVGADLETWARTTRREVETRLALALLAMKRGAADER